jgi:thiol:disulfide interchange protein DsbA
VIRRDFNRLLAACALAGTTGARAAGFDVQGKFQPIVPNQPTETPRGVIEVVDVFGYRCPHCFSFLPVLERFEREVPEDVQVRHMPVIFRRDWEAPARAFYTAKLLGVMEKIHRPIFETLHVEKRPMASDEEWRKLFAEYGVAESDFDKTFNSFAVQSMLRKSQVMGTRYGVSATPCVVVNGKYRVPAGLAGGFDNMIEVTKGLIARERQLLQTSG